VEHQLADERSMLNFTRRLLALRRATPALAIGDYADIPDVPDSCLAWRRTYDGDAFVVVLNFSGEPATVGRSLGTLLLSTAMDRFEELEARGVDGQHILRLGAKVWAEAAMIHGPFHGDMHAGNIWVLDDGRGCFLDFGIMGELEADWQQLLKDLFYTCTFDLDFSRVAASYKKVGAIPAEMDEAALAMFLNSVLGPMLTDGFGSIDIAQLVAQSLQMLKTYDASVPRELVLIAKQLLYIDRYTKFLAPDYSITGDPYIVKNIFPADAAAKATELGMVFPD